MIPIYTFKNHKRTVPLCGFEARRYTDAPEDFPVRSPCNVCVTLLDKRYVYCKGRPVPLDWSVRFNPIDMVDWEEGRAEGCGLSDHDVDPQRRWILEYKQVLEEKTFKSPAVLPTGTSLDPEIASSFLKGETMVSLSGVPCHLSGSQHTEGYFTVSDLKTVVDYGTLHCSTILQILEDPVTSLLNVRASLVFRVCTQCGPPCSGKCIDEKSFAAVYELESLENVDRQLVLPIKEYNYDPRMCGCSLILGYPTEPGDSIILTPVV